VGVHAGVFRGLTVAVKVLRCSILEDADTRGFRQEMSLLSYLQHPHICLFIGYRLQPALSVVMEFCGGGDLGEAARTMPVHTRVSKLMETALGLCYLHGFKTPVVHGDIKVSVTGCLHCQPCGVLSGSAACTVRVYSLLTCFLMNFKE
jgi:serine/threonine protein kinase